MPPFGPQLVHAIKRNFGGLEVRPIKDQNKDDKEDEYLDPVGVFLKKLPGGLDLKPDLSSISPEVGLYAWAFAFPAHSPCAFADR